MNPHFRKGTKSAHGAGHVWVLAAETEGTAGGAVGGLTAKSISPYYPAHFMS